MLTAALLGGVVGSVVVPGVAGADLFFTFHPCPMSFGALFCMLPAFFLALAVRRLYRSAEALDGRHIAFWSAVSFVLAFGVSGGVLAWAIGSAGDMFQSFP